MNRKQTGLVASVMAATLGLGAVANIARAQDNGGQGQSNNNNGGDQNNRGNRGNFRGGFDPQQMWDRFKTELGASDDEWKVLQPRIEKVFGMQMSSRMSMFGGGTRGSDRGGDRGGDRGNRPSPFGGQQDPQLTKARADLQSALEDKSISNEEIGHRLEAYRAAKEKAKQDLAAAQKDLKDLLSPRQEAVLVSRGMLD